MEMNFCRRCGTPLTKHNETEYRCRNNHRIFEAAPAAIGVFLVRGDEVLLVTRGLEPAKGKLDSPGGFVDTGETLEQAISRELQEELHVEPGAYDAPQYVCSAVNDYMFGGELTHPLDAFFWVRVHGDLPVRAGDDALDPRWYRIGQLNPEEIAFKTVRAALEILKTHL